MKFALFFGNRGFFPGELVSFARKEMIEAVTKSGNSYIVLDEKLTKFGAIEGISDGEVYADFLKKNDGNYDGVIMCLPNFSDENGAVYALKDCKKPILIQAYPDEIGKMSFELRRDAYCGKLSIMDMFTQYNIKFTVFEPHVCAPLSSEFLSQLKKFEVVCKIVNGMKRFSIGAIGARTSLFKTVRYDEIALQKVGITIDTFDLSEVFDRALKYSNNLKLDKMINELKEYSDFRHVKSDKIQLIAKVILVILELKDEWRLDCLALRCWNEFPQVLGISACVIVSYLNNTGTPCACELDVGNAVAMRALTLATDNASTCLDWNNNYGEQKDKCILFHCGPVATSMMEDKGVVIEHKMFKKSYGDDTAWGALAGRIKSGEFTYASSRTENGKMQMYLGKGEFTGEPIEKAFFGCGGVAKIENLEKVLMFIGKNGYRHHVSVAFGAVLVGMQEALENYLDYDVTVL